MEEFHSTNQQTGWSIGVPLLPVSGGALNALNLFQGATKALSAASFVTSAATSIGGQRENSATHRHKQVGLPKLYSVNPETGEIKPLHGTIGHLHTKVSAANQNTVLEDTGLSEFEITSHTHENLEEYDRQERTGFAAPIGAVTGIYGNIKWIGTQFNPTAVPARQEMVEELLENTAHNAEALNLSDTEKAQEIAKAREVLESQEVQEVLISFQESARHIKRLQEQEEATRAKRMQDKRGHVRRHSLDEGHKPISTEKSWRIEDIDPHESRRQFEEKTFNSIWENAGIKAKQQLMSDKLAGSQKVFDESPVMQTLWHTLQTAGSAFSEALSNLSFVGSAHAATPSETLMIDMHQADINVDALSGGKAGGAGLAIAGLTRFLAKYARPLTRQGRRIPLNPKALNFSSNSTHPSTPVGRKNGEITIIPGTNKPAVIEGQKYSDHALDRMQERGIVPSIVKEAITAGTKKLGSSGRTLYYDSKNNLTVVMDSETIVTARFGVVHGKK